MDWPTEKLHVYLLDDGRRKEFEQFAYEAGIGYRTRPDNQFAKAGNINAALKTTTSSLVAVFDSDHVPTRSFLQMTIGWFLRDPKLAVMQTPHRFYSPDPFERNLKQFHIIPNEGELFYGVVQDGNDFWNSSFFCGSCAVLRRAALDEIGGIAGETVTEDAHTSLRMQMAGWNTAYIIFLKLRASQPSGSLPTSPNAFDGRAA
ncbi:MAG: glycosyltransferase [Terracidiphilus sp.]